MPRLLYILFCCIVGISLSTFISDKKEFEEEENECEENPEASPVTEMSVAAVPFSNHLVNYTFTGLSTQAGAINCLVVSRTDSNLVLAGSQNGGVWISLNAAHSWQPVNDTARSLCVTSIAQNYFRPNEFYYSTGVNITVNNQLLYDIYRSVDFGQTFSLVNPVTFPSFGRVSEILASPIDSNTLYVLNNAVSGTGSVYRTTDNCNTFQLVYQATVTIDDIMILPNGTVEIAYAHSVWRSTTGNSGTFVQATGLPASGYDTHIAFCESQPNIQYCNVHVFPGWDVYKSTDSGQTWSYISNTGQGRRLAVKPDDPDFVFAGNITANASTDGGLTWQYSWGGHDLRSFNFDPHRNGKVYITSDFGVCTQEVAPFTATSLTDEYRADTLLNSQEIYHGDHGASGIQTMQGYQDLGCTVIQNNAQWKHILSGDGSYVWVSKQNPDFGYISDHDADMYRVTNLTTNPTFTPILNQLDGDNDGNVDDGTMFVHPFIMNNANDSQLYIPTFHWLWRSLDRGNNWTQVSHATGNDFADVSAACTHKPNPIVYWTNSDSVFVFANAATAAPLTEFGREAPFDAGRCYVDPDNDSALYMLNRTSVPYRISYNANLFNPSSTWTTIPTSMLTGITIQCLAFYPGNNQIILAGSKEGGLYITMNRGLTWTKEVGMPNVQITEIKIRESDKKVFIFTYGRGTWTADFATTVSVSSQKNNSDITVYPNPFKDHMTISLDRELNGIVQLTDMQGKQCLKKSVSGKHIKINTEDVAPGLYMITVFQNNKLIYQVKGIRVK